MNCFVTGASGFIGANLVHELVARGHRVRALIRPGASALGLEGVRCERLTGDIRDAGCLPRFLDGCDWCFHVAASYHLWLADYGPMYDTNVAGTRNVLKAAGTAGCRRIVYTSTVGCVGVSSQNGNALPSDESSFLPEEPQGNHYKRSKWQAERVALEFARRGLPIVIVNPTAPFGPWDARPTPTGRLIVDFLNGRMPAYLDTGLNYVHVRDVAVGHILAAERGRPGERYILGHASGNWPLKEAFNVLESLSGVAAPTLRLPYWAACAAARVNETVSAFTGKPPKAPMAGVRMARHKMFFNPAKAIRELGLPQTPPRQALLDAVNWFRENGYVRNGRHTLGRRKDEG